MTINLTPGRKVEVGFSLALLLLLAVSVLSFASLRELRHSRAWTRHTEEVLRRISSIESDLALADGAKRGYLATGDEAFLEPYYSAPARIRGELRTLRELVSDNPQQIARLDTLEFLAGRRLQIMDSTITVARSGRVADAITMVAARETGLLSDSVTNVVRALGDHELALLDARQNRESSNASRTLLIVLIGGALALLIVAVSRRSIMRELASRQRAEAALAQSEQSLRQLYDIASSQSLDFREKLHALVAMGADRYGMAVGVLSHVRNGSYETEAVHDRTGRWSAGSALPLEDTYCVAVLDSADTVALESIAGTPWEESSCYRQFGLQSYLGAPVRLNGRPYGTLAFAHPDPRPGGFTDSDKDFLRLMAQWIGGELDRRQAVDRLRQREERYRVLVESASDLIFTTDAGGHFDYVNPTAARTVGYSATELRGMHAFELIRPDHHDVVRKAAATASTEAAGMAYVEFPVITRDGREIWLGENLQGLTVDGEPAGTQAVARDITRQLELESMKDEFLSVVSHELRTPLTAIRGSLGLLNGGSMGTLDQRGQRMLQIAAQNTDRLVRLINDLLDIEKLESGKATMERQPVDIAELIRGAVEGVQPLADKAGVALKTTSASVSLEADPDRIVQVLTNLVSNAIKFSDPGDTVTVEAGAKGADVLCRVKDEGRGIPADKLEAVFERFQQVDSSDARQKGGTGLGLPIARSIVQQHGGRMWVESEWGRGSTFSFTLPLSAPAAPASMAETTPAIADSCHVLVVEDDPDVAGIISEMLRNHGLRSCHAHDGAEAIEVSRSMAYELLILDPGLPVKDGFGVVDWLRRHDTHRGVPVLVYTAHDLSDAERERLRLGPTEFMIKTRNSLEELEQRVLSHFPATATDTESESRE